MAVCVLGCLGDRVSRLSTFQVDDHCKHVVVARPVPNEKWFRDCTSGGGGGVGGERKLGTQEPNRRVGNLG